MIAPAMLQSPATELLLTPPAPLEGDELTDEDLELVVGGLARARVQWDAKFAGSRIHSGM